MIKHGVSVIHLHMKYMTLGELVGLSVLIHAID